MSANCASECFTILHEENLFSQKDVIFMQFLCQETGCEELYSQCIKYALANKALCYFEKPPGMLWLRIKCSKKLFTDKAEFNFALLWYYWCKELKNDLFVSSKKVEFFLIIVWQLKCQI